MRLMKFHTGDQVVTAIAGEPGRLYTPVVWIDAPIRLVKVPNDDVTRYGRDYVGKPSLPLAARTILRAGKKLGITKSAKQFLRDIAK